MASLEPKLMRHLLEADQRRLHVLAFVLAHAPSPKAEGTLAHILATWSSRKMVGWCVDNVPEGLIGALGRLGSDVMPPSDYRRLLKIVRDPARGRLLRHRRPIWPSDIVILDELPDALCRQPILEAFDGDFEWLRGFTLAFSSLRDRTDIEARLAQVTSSAGCRSVVREIAESLPPPPYHPPQQVRSWKRIDDPRELRRLGRKLTNCIGDYTDRVRDGLAAVYLSVEGDEPIVCVAVRMGRLGWFVDDMKVSDNRDVPVTTKPEIVSEFLKAGMPPSAAANALFALIDWHDPYRGARHRRRCWKHGKALNSPIEGASAPF